MRPGRLDRCVNVPLPDAAGRAAILRVHARSVRCAPRLDLDRVAGLAEGFSGADLANVVNEAALLAVRNRASAVGLPHFLKAVERAYESKQAARGGTSGFAPCVD